MSRPADQIMIPSKTSLRGSSADATIRAAVQPRIRRLVSRLAVATNVITMSEGSRCALSQPAPQPDVQRQPGPRVGRERGILTTQLRCSEEPSTLHCSVMTRYERGR